MGKYTVEAVADKMVTLKVADKNYRNSFVLKGDTANLVQGSKVAGTIHAPAWKVDRVALGGNYVEPLYGRPRRMQGTILAVKAGVNELVVQVGYEVTVKLPEKYKASEYQVGERIGWDNIEVPTLELV